MFSWPCSIHEIAPFWGFLGPFSRKYDSSLLKFDQKYIFHKTNITSEQSLKIKYWQKQDVPKVDDFGLFLDLIYPHKTQNIAKNENFFQKLYPFDYQITQVAYPR